MSFLKLRQFWSSKRESWGQALASVRRVANIVNITSKAERERTWKTGFVRWSKHGGDRQVKKWDNSDSVCMPVD